MSIEKYWYQSSLHPLLLPLLPFSYVYGWLTGLRRWVYRTGIKNSQKFPIPVIVIGNITVGGTGKTPLTAWLAERLIQAGFKPGIAMRGVGGKRNHSPRLVAADADPYQMGDEAVLLAQNTHCPVAICIDRSKAVQQLIDASCNIILTDDGLQHYRLARQVEIAVIDGSRYFGNGKLLPAGPLREPPHRLNTVDFVVINAAEKATSKLPENRVTFDMQLHSPYFVALDHPTRQAALSQFASQTAHAIAGIGNPQRFFDLLKHFNINIIPHAFPDHHPYQAADLDFPDQLPILMTEKDAVKCKNLVLNKKIRERLWVLPVKAELSSEFIDKLLQKI